MSAKSYDPTAPMIERLQTLRAAVRKDTCDHDWVHVQGATICCNCGADLNKMLDEYRKISDPEAGGIRRAVDADQQMDPEPEAPPVGATLTAVPVWVWYLAAAIVGSVIGYAVIQ